MNPTTALLPFLRRASRIAAALAAVATMLAVAAAAWMYFLVLPNIADHRDTVAGLMSRALGQRVTLDSVSGAWQQARPEFRLRGVRLYDAQNRPALELPEFEAAFAWRSLLFLEPRFNRIELRGLSLDVRRTRDGRFYVGGLPVDPADQESGVSEWLLKQGRVHVDNATLVWHDEKRGAPPLSLAAVDIVLDRMYHEHRLRASAQPPAALARPIALEAKLIARDVKNADTWNGHIDVTVAGVSFPHLAAWLDMPWQPRAGWGAVRARFDVGAGRLTGVGADLDLRTVELQFDRAARPLRLARARGQASWRLGPDGERIAVENLRVAWPNGTLGAPFDAGIAWNGEQREITARAVKLDEWENVLPGLPLEDALRARLARLDPRGTVDLLRLGWRGERPAGDNFTIDARFSKLGVTADGAYPGLDNLSGRIEGDARGGRFEVDARTFAIDLPQVMREPALRFDELRATGGWSKTSSGHRLTFDRAAFANADLAGTAKGHYDWIPGTPGEIDLRAQLDRASGTAVYRYFPRKIGDDTVAWTKQGVMAGRADEARLTLRGDLARFPFDAGGGEFRVDVRVRDATIRYAPDWPVIENVDARLTFAGKTMEVVSERARLYGVALAPVRAVIPDLVHHDEELQVAGEARGAAQDFIRFSNSSPVGERLRGFTDALEGDGPMRLALNLRVPLRRSHDTTLAGRLSLLGVMLHPRGLPSIEHARGDIDFTHDSLSARALAAQFLGGPLRLDALTQNGQVRLLAQGRATAAGLTPWAGPDVGARLSGQTAWRGQMEFEPGGERVRVESDLTGLASALPAPLTKPAQQALPLLASSQPFGTGTLHEVRLGRIVAALWRTDAQQRFDRGEIRFGGAAALPPDAGLRLAGNARGLDISGWTNLLPEEGSDRSVPISGLDLGFESFDLMGRRFQDVRLQGRTRNGLLRTQVSGREVSGTLTYRPAGEQPARLSAQFRQLVIPERSPVASGSDSQNMKAADFPVLDLVVEDFRLQDQMLGRLDVVARGVPQGLAIESLQLSHPDSVFRMKGLWRDSGVGETRAELDLSVLDAGRFLARFGFPDALRRGSATVAGNAAWEGSPADFAFSTLAGQLDFKAKNGQFLKVEPGVGKLLGVLSLQSLPRRLNFDFRDIFSSGYAFDDIGATLRIARGVVYSDDFRMHGPAAKVNMSGLADLGQESVQLRVKVIPKLSESVAVAGALLGGPVAGVGALAAQKLLRDPVEEAISQEYMVTGAWSTPDVKRLTKVRNASEDAPSDPGP